MSPVPAAVSPSKTYLQVSLETTPSKVDLDVNVLVNCTEPMKYISYELLGRGDVIKAATFQIENLKVGICCNYNPRSQAFLVSRFTDSGFVQYIPWCQFHIC